MATQLAPCCPGCGRGDEVRSVQAILRAGPARTETTPLAQRLRCPALTTPAPGSGMAGPVGAEWRHLLGLLLRLLTSRRLAILPAVGLLAALGSLWLLDRFRPHPAPGQDLAMREVEWERQRADQRARTRYEQLVYCQPCDRVFVPGEPTVAAPEAMRLVLYQPVQVWRGQAAELDLLLAEGSPSNDGRI